SCVAAGPQSSPRRFGAGATPGTRRARPGSVVAEHRRRNLAVAPSVACAKGLEAAVVAAFAARWKSRAPASETRDGTLIPGRRSARIQPSQPRPQPGGCSAVAPRRPSRASAAPFLEPLRLRLFACGEDSPPTRPMARTPEVVELRCCRPAGAGGPTLAAAEAALAPEERTRAGRFARPEDRALFATARWLARTMLEEATGIAAQAWRFSAAVHGKPVATAEGVRPDRAPHVNWAHTGGLVVCGLARGVEVGVDVESTRRQARTAALARRFFRPDEVRDLAADPCDPRRFWATWTLKEACLKALGTGFTRSPQSFAVDPGP